MKIELIHGDCLVEMKKIPDKSIDLVLTDPPYGLNFPYNSFEDTHDNMKKLIDLSIPEILRVAKLAVISIPITNMMIYPQPNWMIICTWNTTGTYGKFGVNQYIPCFVYGKDIKGFGSINGIIKGDVIKENGGGSVGFQSGEGEKKHPCPKPYGIIKKLVLRCSQKKDTVLDCFMGSGTTGMACKELGRNFIGIEIDKGYYEIAKKRIENTQEMML